MDAAIYKALTGAVTQMRRLEVASHDLANLNTAGYKGERLAFREMLSPRVPTDDRPGGFVGVAAQRTNVSQGGFEPTGNPFHLGLEGDGYFVVQSARGERYTRNGSFTMRSDGTVITAQGEPLLGEGGPLQLTGNNFEVAGDGTVRSDGNELGRLRLVRFIDPQKPEKEGANLFASEPANVTEASEVRIMQGNLEQANVNAVDSMVGLISINRNFEAYQRAMKLLDGATEKMLADSAR